MKIAAKMQREKNRTNVVPLKMAYKKMELTEPKLQFLANSARGRCSEVRTVEAALMWINTDQ